MRLAILALAVGTIGCSSQYFPRAPNHVTMTMQDGKLVYVRDGRTFEPGLGGGLVEAVQGNGAAVAAAEEFRSRQITGLAATLLGTAGFVGGFAWTGAYLGADSNRPSSDYTAPGLLVVAGLVAMIVGASYIATAQPYQWDAINLFNDGAGGNYGPPLQRPPTFTPPPPPPGYGPSASLRMRSQ
ncbi:MAG TPA: hypothetical protein VMJ10_24480 [Kofleriaceae bacterium]|nr:hypothetical protein [Kofleriaceae bacterium]